METVLGAIMTATLGFFCILLGGFLLSVFSVISTVTISDQQQHGLKTESKKKAYDCQTEIKIGFVSKTVEVGELTESAKDKLVPDQELFNQKVVIFDSNEVGIQENSECLVSLIDGNPESAQNRENSDEIAAVEGEVDDDEILGYDVKDHDSGVVCECQEILIDDESCENQGRSEYGLVTDEEIEVLMGKFVVDDDGSGGGGGEKDDGLILVDDEEDDWEGIERSELERVFGAAVFYVASKGNADKISSLGSDTKLQLYGLHKVAIQGPCLVPQPMALKVSARAKWYH